MRLLAGSVSGAALAVSLVITAHQRPARTPDIYFTPTREVVADEMLKLARVGADDVVYDLGSGDGRIVILAAQKYGARGVGVELDPRLVEISRQVAREGDVADRVTFVEGDLFTTNISKATVVTLYLSTGINRQLEPKLKRELRPGARIVSHQFRIGDWTPDETVRAEDGTDLFLWRIRRPPRAASSSSMMRTKASIGCAPERNRPLMKNPGVPLTPRLEPSFRSFCTAL